MRNNGRMLTGLMMGAGAMYLLDPDRGARRRSLLRDKGVRAGRKLGEGVGTTARDVRNRSAGVAATLRSRLRRDEAGDEIVHERVRATLGRAVSHPGAIDVTVFEGRVILGGAVLARELDDLLAAVRRVRGVTEVENQLQVMEHPGSLPSLQGEGRPRRGRTPLTEEVWNPTTRLVVGGLGGALAARGIRSGGFTGGALATLGVGLLARAATNLPPRRLLGVGAGRRAIDVQKAITVAVPVEQVWALWSDFENFPRFMAHLQEVRRTGDRTSHWKAVGPGGVPVEWDAEITEWRPHELIAWKSVEGSSVGNAGVVRFRRLSDAGTEIDVRLSYAPPAGALGHAVASLFGRDPKGALDEDLVRLKSLLEEGKTSADEGTVKLEELESRRETAQPW